MTALLARSHEIRAMLDGTFGMIVRPLKPQPQPFTPAPPYYPGNLVCVKEAWVRVVAGDAQLNKAVYRADSRDSAGDYWHEVAAEPENVIWRSSAVMPQWASRLTLSVTDVAVKRLHDVTTEEAIHAGTLSEKFLDDEPFVTSVFAEQWNQHNRAHPWDSNPWIVAAKCSAHHKNIKDVKEIAA